MDPWWVGPLKWGLWGVVMALVMGWLGRSRTAPSDLPPGVLAQPRSVLIIGWVCTLLFVALGVMATALPEEEPAVWPAVVFGLFALMGGYMIVDYHRSRYELTPDGLRYGRALGDGGGARWDQVRRVRWSETAKWFRLDLADGRVVRISAMLQGLPAFATEVLGRLPAETVDPNARALLESTARGQPPSVWG